MSQNKWNEAQGFPTSWQSPVYLPDSHDASTELWTAYTPLRLVLDLRNALQHHDSTEEKSTNDQTTKQTKHGTRVSQIDAGQYSRYHTQTTKLTTRIIYIFLVQHRSGTIKGLLKLPIAGRTLERAFSACGTCFLSLAIGHGPSMLVQF